MRALVLLAAVLLAPPARGATLCAARSGRVAARARCRRSERVLDATQLGLSALTGARGTPGASGAPGVFPLALVDSRGVELGPIVGFDPVASLVALSGPSLGTTVFFEVGATGFFRNIGGAISHVDYLSAGCAGVPYLVFADLSMPPIGQVYGTAAYVPTGPSALLTIASEEYDPNGSPCGGGATDTGRGTCCAAASTMEGVSPGARVSLATLGFVPPFRAVPR
ncbi:MAG TPA: hypothetical protein VKW76_05665 [Candidatus Binatia bacterium]|nr:hypothetical protein [Candidatus Binatia bacterium]